MIRKITVVPLIATLLLVGPLTEGAVAQSDITGGFQRLDQSLVNGWPKRIARPSGNPHHGILINDVFVAPVAHGESVYPCCENDSCCEKSCARKTDECAGCPAGECKAGGECVKHKKLAHKECKRCKDGNCPLSFERNKSTASPRDPASETARAVLEIMDTLGHSVIAGTEFEPTATPTPEELPSPLTEPADIRAALVKYIRALESERTAGVRETSATVNISDQPIVVSEMTTPAESSPADTVDALRESSMALDDAASQLEALELYERADQVRALAQALRHDARRLKSGGRVVHARRHAVPVVEPICNEGCPEEALPNVERHLRMLHEAMRREVTE
ncbi:MAG: hypothetical protein KF708_17640 [Pirellulales bacterium]|nr:hypothetical protein [Pirellulales bacterium]